MFISFIYASLHGLVKQKACQQGSRDPFGPGHSVRFAKVGLAKESNTIRRPSGDHLGDPQYAPPIALNCSGLFPSLLETQISVVPLRSDTNAIFLPSGENCGLLSVRVEAITSTAGPQPCLKVPRCASASIRQ